MLKNTHHKALSLVFIISLGYTPHSTAAIPIIFAGALAGQIAKTIAQKLAEMAMGLAGASVKASAVIAVAKVGEHLTGQGPTHVNANTPQTQQEFPQFPPGCHGDPNTGTLFWQPPPQGCSEVHGFQPPSSSIISNNIATPKNVNVPSSPAPTPVTPTIKPAPPIPQPVAPPPAPIVPNVRPAPAPVPMPVVRPPVPTQPAPSTIPKPSIQPPIAPAPRLVLPPSQPTPVPSISLSQQIPATIPLNTNSSMLSALEAAKKQGFELQDTNNPLNKLKTPPPQNNQQPNPEDPDKNKKPQPIKPVPPLKFDLNGKTGWNMSKKGSTINERYYTRHGLERMAPKTEELTLIRPKGRRFLLHGEDHCHSLHKH